MMPTNRIVFLVDVDDTLLANDRIQDDIQRQLEREYGAEAREGKPALLAALHPPDGKLKWNACPACKPGAADTWRSAITLRNHASRARCAPEKLFLHREKW